MEERSDLELVEQVRNGSRESFTALMRRHQERVYWIARRMTGSHEEADDIAQDTFIRAYLHLGDFRGDSSFFTWLYRIAVNLSLNAIRKKQIVGYLRESLLLQRFLPPVQRPDEVVQLDEMEQKLHREIARLPEKQRAVFVLRFFDGLPYEQIGDILKTSVGGLKANYHHALKKIQEGMKDERGS